MPVALVCSSHSPLMHRGPASEDKAARVKLQFENLAGFVQEFDPEYVIQFSPDHFNGFFYDLMPAFCIGAGAESIGDWGGMKGELNVPHDTALALIRHLHHHDFDAAVSYRMCLDHGFVQIWEAMLGSFGRIPIVPIFVNCAAPPLPSYRRVRQFGECVGRFVSKTDRRVLFVASGGLSHDPPVPSIETCDPETRERLISGRNPSAEARTLREQRILDVAVLADAGSGPCMALNQRWDEQFIECLQSGTLARIDSFDTDEVRRVAGRGANEVLCWAAAFAALAAGGPYAIQHAFYEAIPGWIAGFAAVAALPSSDAP